MDGVRVLGVQHKYAETCLVFPAAGQTCHSYCSYCFRWPQFVDMPEFKLATNESMRFCRYIRQHREITDVLLTGGDPMVMRVPVLARYVGPLLAHSLNHVRTIRIGTKSLSYWPYRYLSDADSDDLMRLFERIVASGKHLAIMAHFSHWRELDTEPARQAIQRLQSVGAVVRTQAPLVRYVNDEAEVWSRMWQMQTELNCIPYYMFVERNTGAHRYFKVPLHRAFQIYTDAICRVSGLARTARGPIMSALPGKVALDGLLDVGGRPHFVLSFLQARNPQWCRRPFLAKFDANASWLSELRPPDGIPEFFYEPELREMLHSRRQPRVVFRDRAAETETELVTIGP